MGLIKTLPIVKQYYPKLNPQQLERIVKTIFALHLSVMHKFPPEISARKLCDIFLKVQSSKSKSDKSFAIKIKDLLVGSFYQDIDLSIKEWQSLYSYNLFHNELATFMGSEMSKKQLIGYSRVWVGLDDTSIKQFFSFYKQDASSMRLLKKLAQKPNKFPNAKRLYDLLTPSNTATPAPVPVPTVSAPVTPAPTTTAPAVNWDAWIRDLPADKLKQKALLEQTDLQGLSGDQVLALFEKLKDDAENCGICFAKVENSLVLFNPAQVFKIWQLIKKMPVAKQFYPKLSTAQVEPILRCIFKALYFGSVRNYSRATVRRFP